MKKQLTKKEFLLTSKEKIIASASLIKEKKAELRALCAELKTADEKNKRDILRKCSALQSSLHSLRSSTAIENIAYALIKNWSNEKLKEELLKKFRHLINYYFQFSNCLYDKESSSLIFEEESLLLISRADRIDKKFIKELEARDALIKKINDYGKEYAETLNIPHPFNNTVYCGNTYCEYSRRDGWSFDYNETDIIIYWSEDISRCSSSEYETKSLKIPLEYFSQYAEPIKKAEMENKIATKKLIDECLKRTNTLNRNISKLKNEILGFKKDFNKMSSDYSKICGMELSDEAKKTFNDQLKEKTDALAAEELKLKPLQEQLKILQAKI